MYRKLFRPVLAMTVLAATVALFIYYIDRHPETIRQLKNLPPQTLCLLLGLYGVFLGTLIWVQRATLALCDMTIGNKESMLLIMYSSIINFFGPLQSGPAFRAAYLKKRHNIKLKNYTVATLLYYAFYAVFSGLFVLSYIIGLWALVAALAVVGLTALALRSPQLLPKRFRGLQLRNIGSLAGATLAQVSVLAIIFYIELGSFGQQIAAIPALIYTGAANFALFVSVTPGAIGFRESFVLFSQQLHHIPAGQVVIASLIDRGVYVLFLGILVIITASMHAKRYLGASDAARPE